MPAAVYRALRDESFFENPNPVVVQSWGSIQTSRQDTAHLLCRRCEQKFSVAERWIMKHGIQQDDSFPLNEALRQRASIILRGPDVTVYSASSIPQMRIDLLAIFALSIFWRYAIYDWPTAEGTRIMLGPYEEKLRTFLLGQSSFPENTTLCVSLRPIGPFLRLVRIPHTAKVDAVRVHTFVMMGYFFSYFCGQSISDAIEKFCIVNAPSNPIMISSMLENSFLRSAISAMDAADIAQAQRSLKSSHRK